MVAMKLRFDYENNMGMAQKAYQWFNCQESTLTQQFNLGNRVNDSRV